MFACKDMYRHFDGCVCIHMLIWTSIHVCVVEHICMRLLNRTAKDAKDANSSPLLTAKDAKDTNSSPLLTYQSKT